MTRRINSWGDRMLARVLRQETAGACVPPDPCGLAYSHSYCHNGKMYDQYCPGRFNCGGACVPEYSQGSGCVSDPNGRSC
ncbi:hypothetical protein ABIA35_006764 [Catenulispora sp. MAP12-49]|uniref:hypothetical protein n=1 Tax=unclassified Catenulispora TaxID=414885 RepID=UPI003517F0E0